MSQRDEKIAKALKLNPKNSFLYVAMKCGLDRKHLARYFQLMEQKKLINKGKAGTC